MIFTFRQRPNRRRRVLPLATALAVAVLAGAAAGAQPPPGPAESLRAVVESYTPRQAVSAKRAAADAFFQFEGSMLDRELAARDPALYREVEREWMRLLQTIEDGRPADAVRSQGEHVLALLDRGARAAGAGGSVFFDSLLIILREGFEAILIVSALAAYLQRIGERSRLPYLYGGAAVAVAASFLLWAAARSVLSLGGADREALEGWTILLAAGVLFWVSYWLLSKAQAEQWQAFVRRRVEHAVGRGALFGLGFLSFVVVFREGFETVLFYEAVAARASGPSMLVAGFLTGCAALAVLYVAFQRLGSKIPLGAFFNVTGGLLYFMAVRFAGAGVRELQEADVLPQTPLSFLPDLPFLEQWLGLFPYLEPLLAQVALIVLALFAFAHRLRGTRAAVPGASPPVERRRAAAARR